MIANQELREGGSNLSINVHFSKIKEAYFMPNALPDRVMYSGSYRGGDL